MNEITLTAREFILYGAAFGALFGLLLGMIPFFLGKRFDKRKHGSMALLVGLAGGALLGIPGGVISAVIFSIVILVNKNSDSSHPEDFGNDQTV
jgi:NhaP-type Na+/H+ or K+/H+ antiporter